MESERSGRKAPEALDDEALDAVAGGWRSVVTGENGVHIFTCDCGATVSVPEGTVRVYCPNCHLSWAIGGGAASRSISPGLN